MARPKKDERDRKSAELRIPLTADQKALIAEATRIAGAEAWATWARPVLLREAEALVESAKARKSPPLHDSGMKRIRPA
jgi:hypothetical protein